MHGEPSTACDDSALLALWVNERRQDAFAQLVAAYQQMVVGAALRRTGDVESARDVAQQVFSALAAKAPWLAGRTSIAGWLYVAASHVAMRAARSEMRRRAAMDRFAAEKPQSEPVAWDKVEDALAALGETDREAIVLHYFQDLGYAEMAARLHIAEPAARKRVSRALVALEQQLARQGVRGAAALVLAGAVAQQSSAASVAITISSGAASVPWALTISAMAKHTTTKIAASIAALMLIPLGFQWRANASAQAEISTLRRNLPTAGNGSISAARGEERLAALQAEVTAARSAADAAEKRLGELAELKRLAETEVVYSLGSLEKMAQKLAQFIRMSETTDENEQRPDPSTEEGRRAAEKAKADAQTMAELMGQMLSTMRELPEIERSPEKAARFYSAFYSEYVELDEKRRAELERRVGPWTQGLQESGLAFSQRPKDESRKIWDMRRMHKTATFLSELAHEFPGKKPVASETIAALSVAKKNMTEEDIKNATPKDMQDAAEFSQMLDMLMGGGK